MHALLLIALLLAAIPVSGQTSDGVEEDPGLIITTESSLVIVPLHVYKGKKSVNGLGKDAFELLENGAVQNIAFAEGPGSGRTVPVEIILLMDVSHSVMRPGLLTIQAIRNTFLKGGLRDDVNISVYGFAKKLTRFTEATRNPARIENAFKMAYDAEDGQTRVFEAMIQTMRDATSQGGNASRMLVVFSDGLSTTELEPVWVSRAANLLGVPIYPVVLGHRTARNQQRQTNLNNIGRLRTNPSGNVRKRDNMVNFDPRNNRGTAPQAPTAGNNKAGTGNNKAGTGNNKTGTGNTQRATRARSRENRQLQFAELGPQTGGRSFDLKTPSGTAIRSILSYVSTLAQTEYIVGYYPSSLGEEPSERAVEVRLAAKDVGKLYGGKRTIVH